MQTLHSLHLPPTLFPAKVTYKNSGKNASKTYKCTVTVKNPGVRLVENPAVVVNEKTNVVAKAWPKSATVEYKSSDETIATVDATGEVTGVKAGKATITATMTCGTKVVTKTTEVTVRAYEFQSVTQKEATVLEAVITGDTKSVKAADIKITNTFSNGNITVKGISVDRKDSSKVLITTYQSMVDGKEYKVMINGVEKTFTATDGKVAAVDLEKTKIVAGELTDINAVTMDANGVIIGRYAYPYTGQVQTVITVSNGYTSGKQLLLYNVGDTAVATVTWHSNVRDANGAETGNIEKKDIIITAVAEEEVETDGWSVKVGNDNATYNTVKATKLAIGDLNKVAYIQLVNTTSVGSDPSNDLTGYTVESSDLNSLIVSATVADMKAGKIALTPRKEGTVYLIIKKANAIVATLPITIEKMRTVAGISLNRSAVTLSADVTEPVIIETKFKDQYGEDLAVVNPSRDVTITPTTYAAPNSAPTPYTAGLNITNNGISSGVKSVTIAPTSVSGPAGVYTVDFSFGTLKKTLAVTVVKQTGAVVTTGYELGMEISAKDTVITSTTTDNDLKLTAQAYKTTNGIKTAAVTQGAIDVALKDSYGRPVNGALYGIYGVSGDGKVGSSGSSNLLAVDADGKITITLAKANGTLKLPAGTYRLEVTANTSAGYTMPLLHRDIVVTDTQAPVICAIKSLSGKTLGDCMAFYYEGTPVTTGITYYDITNLPVVFDTVGTTKYVAYATVTVPVGNGNFALQRVDINTSFTQTAY